MHRSHNAVVASLSRSGRLSPRRWIAAAALWISVPILAVQAEWTWLHPLPQSNDLYAAWAPAADDLYVGGHGGTILHWDGAAWTHMPTPTHKTIFGIHGTAADDIWAVGGDAYTEDILDRCLILHYNGASWTEVPAPEYYGWTYPLNDVLALAPNNAYAIQENGTAIAHWDGVSWEFESVPLAVEGGFDDIAAIGTDHIFVVGTHGQILHRTGGAWSLEQKTEDGSFSVNILTSIWGRDNGGTLEVLVGGNFGQVYERSAGGAWNEIDLNSGCFSMACDAIAGLWGTAPDDLYLVGGDNIRHSDGSAPPIAREDYLGQIRGGWYGAEAAGDRIYMFGSRGVVHEYLLDGSGSGTLSPLTVGEPSLNTLRSLAVAACGDSGFLAFGNTEYTAQHPLWLYDGTGFQKLPIPDTMPQQAWVRAALATGPDDVVINWRGLSTSAHGTYHWDGANWSPLGPSSSAPWHVIEFWRSPTDVLYAAGPAEVKSYANNAWSTVLAYGSLGYDVTFSAFCGVSDTELYIGSEDGRIWRYNGSEWSEETTPESVSIAAMAAANGDVYAVGADANAWRRSGSAWQQLADVDVRSGDGFSDVIAGDGFAYACQGTAQGYIGGGLGRIWRFEGATASMVVDGMSLPLDGLARAPNGSFYGVGSLNGHTVVLTEGAAPADMFLMRVDLSYPLWTYLGPNGAGLRIPTPTQGRPMVAAWSFPSPAPLFDPGGMLPGGQTWTIRCEKTAIASALPEMYVGFLTDPLKWPEGIDFDNSTLYRQDGSGWQAVDTQPSLAATWLETVNPTELSAWTYAGPAAIVGDLRIEEVTRTPTGVQLRWSDMGPDYGYTVLARDELNSGDWAPASGTTWPIPDLSWTDTDLAGHSLRFYRIEAATTD